MFMSMILIAKLGLIIVGEVCGMEFLVNIKVIDGITFMVDVMVLILERIKFQ